LAGSAEEAVAAAVQVVDGKGLPKRECKLKIDY
jgi:hypothetical protein